MERIGTFLVFCIFVFTGCANYAVSTKNDPKCVTVVSGHLICAEKWIGKRPALIIKDRGEIRSHFGDITEIDSAGVWFDRTNEGLIFSSPRYYPFSKIVCLVDENNEVIYGEIPKKFGGTWDLAMKVKPADDPNGKAFILYLEANREFSFCLPPGRYVVDGLVFNRGYSFSDIAVSVPALSFTCLDNKTNYIGDIYLDSLVQDVTPNVIECRIGSRPSDATVGLMFGLIGAALVEASRSGDRLEHRLTILNGTKPDNAEESLLGK